MGNKINEIVGIKFAQKCHISPIDSMHTWILNSNYLEHKIAFNVFQSFSNQNYKKKEKRQEKHLTKYAKIHSKRTVFQVHSTSQ